MVPLPLLLPNPPLSRDALRLRGKMRGAHRGVRCSKGISSDGSGAFRSANLTPCTVWPRTVMRGNSRKKVNSGHNSVPKSARRTEPSPRTPVSLHISDVSAQRKGQGSQEGRETLVSLPLLFLPVNTGIPPPKAAIVHAHLERKVASTGCAAVSAEPFTLGRG